MYFYLVIQKGVGSNDLKLDIDWDLFPQPTQQQQMRIWFGKISQISTNSIPTLTC
jgi:hypothetical protein